jgi:hypothetical protein
MRLLNYRVTKYNPKYRDARGEYQRNEWTSFSDLGKIFDDAELTVPEYICIEDAYIGSIHAFMDAVGIDSLKVSRLENRYQLTEHDRRYAELYSDQMIAVANSVQNGNNLTGSNLDNFCRLSLRSQLWGVLEHDSQMFVHFGRDYYMYIGVAKISASVIEQIRASGLFIEEFESPYTKTFV